jgi:pimeloyl-ACP methyl ester carboxylesterase
VTLQAKLLAIHGALQAAGIGHAFGGAIALAYATLNPRGTSDIDVNIFAPAPSAEAALAVLPDAIAVPDDTAQRIATDGQARLWWDGTPIDLFFDYVALHAQAARNVRMVDFEGERIPVLAPTELAVFKAMFDRTQDWADIEAMIGAQTLDLSAVRATLSGLVDRDDPRFARLDDAIRRAGG